MFSRLTQFWSRPDGLREVLTLALPLVISSLSWTIMQTIDRILLFGYSKEAVAAVFPAGWMALAVLCLPLGLTTYINTFVSQYHGADWAERIGVAVWQGVFVAVLSIPLMLLATPLAPDIFAWADHPPAIMVQEISYFEIHLWGNGAILLSSSLSAFFTGRGKVATVMIVDLLGAAMNVGLDIVWIYGYLGFPRAGIVGAAWATVVALWLKTLIYFALFLAPRHQATFHTWAGCRFDPELFRRLIRFGGPNGVQMMLENGGWSFLALLLGRFGATALEASSLVFAINGLVFMPVWGVGIAATTLVGQRMGMREPDRAARAAWSAFAVGTVYMFLFSALFVATPDLMLDIYHVIDTHEMSPELHDTSVILLRFVAFYCLFDTMNVIFAGALKGAGDTRFVMGVTVIMGGLPLATIWMGTHHHFLGLYDAWAIMTGVVCSTGLTFMARFIQGKWRRMRVIEEKSIDRSTGSEEPGNSTPSAGDSAAFSTTTGP
jgi:MATE family multidrug resistance protein